MTHMTLRTIKLINENIQNNYQMLCCYQGVLNYRTDLYFLIPQTKILKIRSFMAKINKIYHRPIQFIALIDK